MQHLLYVVLFFSWRQIIFLVDYFVVGYFWGVKVVEAELFPLEDLLLVLAQEFRHWGAGWCLASVSLVEAEQEQAGHDLTKVGELVGVASRI